MDQPPQDPTQPTQQPPAAPPPAAPDPAWGQPAQQAPGPAWGQPAQPAAPQAPGGWVQPAPASQWVQPTTARGPVTGLAKLSGLIILVFGLLWTGLGALILLGGAAAKVGGSQAGIPGLGNAVGDFLAGFGIVILVIAIVEILGGIGILISKEWGRVIGIAYSLIFGFGSIFIVLGGVNASKVDTVGDSSGGFVALVIGLVFLIGYLYSLIVLLARWRSRA